MAEPITNGDLVRSYFANMFKSNPNKSYAPMGLNNVKRANTSAPISAFGKIGEYENNYRQLMADPQVRGATMQGMVTREPTMTPAVANNVAAYNREQSLVDEINSMPKDVLPVPKQKPITSVAKQAPVVQATNKTASGKTNKSKVGQLLAPPALVPATNDTATSASAVGQVVGDTPYQMSNLPIGSGVNQDLYGAEFNNVNRYAGYGEASTGGDIAPPPVTGNAQDTFWENLNRAGGYSAQDWNAMTPEERIKAGALKSNLGSGMEQFGQLASGASALAGIYGTMQNAKYLKDQTKMQKDMIRADDANKSAFAKAAGGTYQRTGV